MPARCWAVRTMLLLIAMLPQLCGDVHPQPGPLGKQYDLQGAVSTVWRPLNCCFPWYGKPKGRGQARKFPGGERNKHTGGHSAVAEGDGCAGPYPEAPLADRVVSFVRVLPAWETIAAGTGDQRNRRGDGRRERCVMPAGCRAVRMMPLLMALLLRLCGDVHPQPGPARGVGECHIPTPVLETSDGVQSGCTMVQETRLTASGQRAMTALARRMGWRALWPPPLENKGGGFWDTAPGGVGVLYRPGMVIQPATGRPDDEEVQALWRSGRWMHAHMAHAEGKAVANIIVVYGIAGQAGAIKRPWNAAIKYTARLGNVAWMVCADCNFPLDNENAMPEKYFTAVRVGSLVDIMKCRASARGELPDHTYDVGLAGGTRIDGILLDPKLASAVTEDGVWAVPGLPGHSKLSIDLDVNTMAQQVTKIKKLQDPPESSMNPEEQSELALAMWGRLQRHWNCLTEEQDTNGMWASWTWLAKEFLLLEDTAGHTAERILRTQWRGPPVAVPTGDAAEHRGRGTQATMYQTRLCPSKKLPTGAPKTRRIRALDSIKGSIKPLYTWAKRRELLPVGGQVATQWPREVEDCWRMACTKIRRIQEIDVLPEGVALQDAERPGTVADLAGLREP